MLARSLESSPDLPSKTCFFAAEGHGDGNGRFSGFETAKKGQRDDKPSRASNCRWSVMLIAGQSLAPNGGNAVIPINK